MKTIFGVDKVRLVDFDGSPSGRKEFVCWNTPYKDPNDPSSGRGDTFVENCTSLHSTDNSWHSRNRFLQSKETS